jgi:hypothetical protein
MISDKFKSWWRALPPEGRAELLVALDINAQYIYNICSNGTSPSFERGVLLINYSHVLAAKYGTIILSPHDIDTKCGIKACIIIHR